MGLMISPDLFCSYSRHSSVKSGVLWRAVTWNSPTRPTRPRN